MKKIFTLLILILAGLLVRSECRAQTHASMINIYFTDALGNPFGPTPEVYVRNTDSAGFSNYPYLNKSVYQGNLGYYLDSCTWDSAFTDTMVSIHYYACGQWYTLDTFFSMQNFGGWYLGWLNLNIQVPCIAPCNASFYGYVYSNGFIYQPYFSHIGNNIHQTWDFGDSSAIDTNNNPAHTYPGPGTYIVRHTVYNDVSNCRDTAWDTVTYAAYCNAGFYRNTIGNGTYRFSLQSAVGYSHYWDMGDGTTRTDSGAWFDHTYSSYDTFLVRHITYLGSHCSDTAYDTVYNVPSGNQYCQYNFANVVKNGYSVTVYPTPTNMPLRYTMGDGNTLIRTGVFTHTYNSAGTYNLTMQDSGMTCQAKYASVSITGSCSSSFSATEDAPFTLSFYGSANAGTTSVYYFGDGDSAIGDTATHVYASQASYFWVQRKIFNTATGALLCTWSDYFYFNACGNSNLNYAPDFINGHVIFNDTFRTDFDSLVVYLIYHDSTNATLTLIDSTIVYSVDSSYFFFEGICYPAGTQFLVKAALVSGSTLYNDFLPTYSDSSVLWSGATSHTTGYWVQINMRRGNNPGGPGFIGGYISQGANKNGAALDGIQVTLLRDDGAPVAYTHSANAGRYEFDNLAYGSYRVLVEIPGKPSQEYNITLDANNESFDDLDFEVNSTDITTTMVSVRNVTNADNLKLYPNPADNNLFVEWTGGNAELVIVDMNGKTCLVKEIAGNGNREEIDVDSFVPGLYYVRINDGVQLRYVRVAIH